MQTISMDVAAAKSYKRFTPCREGQPIVMKRLGFKERYELPKRIRNHNYVLVK